jgi:hypothetical protein
MRLHDLWNAGSLSASKEPGKTFLFVPRASPILRYPFKLKYISRSRESSIEPLWDCARSRYFRRIQKRNHATESH